MTDRDLRTHILKFLYDHRNDGIAPQIAPEDLGLSVSKRHVNRVLTDLLSAGLIQGAEIRNKDGLGVLIRRISGSGVDVVEGSAIPPIPINQTVIIGGSNYGKVGNDNTQYVDVSLQFQALVNSLMGSDMPTEAKRTVLQRLHEIASDGLIGNAVGVASLIAEALDKL